MRELFGGLSSAEIHTFAIDTLREWHRKNPHEREFTMHGDFGTGMMIRAAARKGRGIDPRLKEMFIGSGARRDWMHPIHDFIWWFVRAGMGWPLHIPHNENFTFPIKIYLTSEGVRFLAQEGDHPLLPGFVQRMASRCPGLPDEVVTLLGDAYACSERALLRPSVVMLGVAYELAVERILEHEAARSPALKSALDGNAARRIAALRDHAEALPKGSIPEKERRFAALDACDFASQLRRRRNDASHTTPRYGFADRDEVEELLVSAGRHLPALWALRGSP